jgi:hypothetical protein
MLKNTLICTLTALSFVSLSAKDSDDSVIIGHYSLRETIIPGALSCDHKEKDCTHSTKLACKNCE